MVQKRFFLGLAVIFLGVACCTVALVLRGQQAAAQAHETARRIDEISAVGLAHADLSGPPYNYIWWEEWHVPKDVPERFEQFENEMRFEAIDDVPDSSPKAPTAKAFRALLEQYKLRPSSYLSYGHSVVSIQHLPWQLIVPVTTPEADKVALVGYLPADVRARVPPTGRLHEPGAVAAFHLLVDWQGNPVDVEALKKEREAKDQAEYDRRFPPDTIVRRAKDRARRSRTSYGPESVFGLAEPERLAPHLAAIEEKRLPCPRKLSEEEHATVRLHHPGDCAFGDLVLLPHGAAYPLIARYAQDRKITPDQAFTELVQLQPVLLEGAPFSSWTLAAVPGGAALVFFGLAFVVRK